MWLPIASLLVCGALVVGSYIAWQLGKHRRLLEVWQRWAAKHGYEFVPSDGANPRPSGDRVLGKSGKIGFELELCAERRGDSSRVFARLVAKGPTLVEAPLGLFARSWLSHLNRFLMKNWIVLEDAALNERWLLRGERTDEARSMIAGDFRQCLIDCEGIDFVSIDGGEVEIRFDDECADERTLDLAIELACSAWSSRTEGRRLAS